ncbi:hypothetical protein IFM89_007257 [Coptis chinensis]|uniref:NmrA-like domain-containing protein n=1 Tax=Coptis chinensis TaxID=261450 RepID=A0A835MA78_9MAGN|nr:hypothetical protein IFM89_007257 [Coptis chinensis]
MDPSRMGHALEPGRDAFDKKMLVRKAVEDDGIPITYVSANCFAGYFVGNLSQLKGSFIPPRDKVCLYGDGSVKGKAIPDFLVIEMSLAHCIVFVARPQQDPCITSC